MKRALLACAASLILATGCKQSEPKMVGVSSGSINYSPYEIAGYSFEGVGNEISGGGPEAYPKTPGHNYGGGGESCCGTIPEKWRPDLLVDVTWRVDKLPFSLEDRGHVMWFKARVTLPSYTPNTFGIWAKFMAADRVCLMVLDGKMIGWNQPPRDDDQCVGQGFPVPELNAREAKLWGREKLSREVNARYLADRAANAATAASSTK